jgi:hypothetical protein
LQQTPNGFTTTFDTNRWSIRQHQPANFSSITATRQTANLLSIGSTNHLSNVLNPHPPLSLLRSHLVSKSS